MPPLHRGMRFAYECATSQQLRTRLNPTPRKGETRFEAASCDVSGNARKKFNRRFPLPARE